MSYPFTAEDADFTLRLRARLSPVQCGAQYMSPPANPAARRRPIPSSSATPTHDIPRHHARSIKAGTPRRRASSGNERPHTITPRRRLQSAPASTSDRSVIGPEMKGARSSWTAAPEPRAAEGIEIVGTTPGESSSNQQISPVASRWDNSQHTRDLPPDPEHRAGRAGEDSRFSISRVIQGNQIIKPGVRFRVTVTAGRRAGGAPRFS